MEFNNKSKNDADVNECEERSTNTSVEDKMEKKPAISYIEDLMILTEKLQMMTNECKNMIEICKKLEKDVNYMQKSIKKKYKPREENKRSMSGFNTPLTLSEEMYEFMKIPKNKMVPRKTVTLYLNEYIDTHNLRDSKSREIIRPDETLKRLFRSSSSDTITYFNIHNYIKHHFLK